MIGNDLEKAPAPVSPMLAALLSQEKDYSGPSEMFRARLMARARQAARATKVPLPDRRRAAPFHRLLYAAAAAVVLMASAAAAYEWLRTPDLAPPTPGPGLHSRLTHPVPIEAPQPLAAQPQSEATLPEVAAHRRGAVHATQARLKEIRLLVRARQADARGDYAAVLSIASEHQRSFPAGRLSEERQVLRVRALVGLGRSGEARQVGASFRRQFPHSVLLETVDEMMTSRR